MRVFLVFLAIFCLVATGEAKGISAARKPLESWMSARERAYGSAHLSPLKRQVNLSAEQLATTIDKLEVSSIPELGSYEEVEEMFFYIRNLRYLKDPMKGDQFLRRLSWLYPDDGCFARAGMARHEIARTLKKETGKVFIFGDLTVKTENHPYGEVSWWYHVVAAVRVGNDVYVIDPAIFPHQPALLKDWVLAQVPNLNEALLSICHGDTYGPDDECRVSASPVSYGFEVINYYLQLEYQRQIELERDPQEVLGERPPWISQQQSFFKAFLGTR